MNFSAPHGPFGGIAANGGDTRSEPGPEIRARPLEGALDRPATVENLLTPDEQELLQRHATVVEYRRAGNTIFSEGDGADFVYVIAKGIVRVSRCAENGQRRILAFRVPGDLIGLPESGRYVNSAETVCAARIYRLPWQRMLRMMLAEPRLQHSLLTKVVHDFRKAESRIMTLALQNTYQRLASFILELICLPGWSDERRRLLNLPVNRFDLADYLGTSPESTSRAFARLESEGLVKRVSSRTLEVLDVAGLQKLQRGRRRSDGARSARGRAPSPIGAAE